MPGGDLGPIGAALQGAENMRSRLRPNQRPGNVYSVWVNPVWGDEPINSNPIGLANSEYDRTMMFNKLGNTNPDSIILSAEPGTTSIAEVANIIADCKNNKKKSSLYLAPPDSWRGLAAQYDKMHKKGVFPHKGGDDGEEALFRLAKFKRIGEALPDVADEIKADIRTRANKFLGLPEDAPKEEGRERLDKFIDEWFALSDGDLYWRPEDKDKGKGILELYDAVRKNDEGEDDNLLDNNSADGPYYPYAIRHSIGRIIEAYK